MSRGGRGRGRGGRGSASAELLRDVGEDLGGSANFQAEDEPPPKWPAMVLPSPQIPSPEEIASIGKQRDARKKMRESSVFAELNKDDKDIEPLLSAMGLTRAQAAKLVHEELLTGPKKTTRLRVSRSKRRRADSTASLIQENGDSTRLNSLEDEEKKGSTTATEKAAGGDDDDEDEEPEFDEEEPEDYVKNHYESEEENSGGEEALL